MFLPLFYCNQRVSLKKNMDKQTSLINKIKIELRDSFEAFASGRMLNSVELTGQLGRADRLFAFN